MKIKIITIFGTRPEAIKMIPVIKKLSENENFHVIVCVTAQHRELLDSILQLFNIVPDYDLNIMKKSQLLSEITSKSLAELDKIIHTEKPDMVLVHGDTNTTFAGALAAFYNKVKIGHVEAGLRTFNKFEPFPEEMNRELVSLLADLNFAPTFLAKQNLINEGRKNIFVTGNTAIDCINFTVKKNYVFENKILQNIDFENKKIVVVTAHRRENLGQPLKNICNAILRLSENKNLEFIYAVHPNPNVKNVVENILGNVENIHLLEPLNLNDMHNLLAKSFLVMTDSGGLQEEAPAFEKPVFILRDVTERSEGIDAGVLKLIGTDEEKIIQAVNDFVDNKLKFKTTNPFGDGKAAERICDAILFYFGRGTKPEDFILKA